MALLSNIGYHVNLTKVNSTGAEKSLFPVNTADDVMMDEDGNSLTDYIPVLKNSAETESSPMFAVECGSEEVLDMTYAKLIAVEA